MGWTTCSEKGARTEKESTTGRREGASRGNSVEPKTADAPASLEEKVKKAKERPVVEGSSDETLVAANGESIPSWWQERLTENDLQGEDGREREGRGPRGSRR